MNFILKIFVLLLFYTGISSADIQKIKSDVYSSLEKFLGENFDNTDFNIKSIENTKPEISIKTLKPIIKNENDITFIQGSLFTHDGDRETLNLGLGKRFLKDNENLMIGINTFYDREIDENHHRTSIGGEIQSSILELNMNNYFAISGKKDGKNGNTEEALDGYDIEVGAHLPFMPTWKFYTKMFEFDVPSGKNFEGYEYSSEFLLPNFGLTLGVGQTDYSNHQDEWFFSLKYNFKDVDRSQSLINNQAYERVSMKDQLEKKVRRDNIIKKDLGFNFMAGGF
jgi:adhesin/invasin